PALARVGLAVLAQEYLLDGQVGQFLGAAPHFFGGGRVRQAYGLRLAAAHFSGVGDLECPAVAADRLDAAFGDRQQVALALVAREPTESSDVLGLSGGELAAVGRAADEVDVKTGSAAHQEHGDAENRQDDGSREPVVADAHEVDVRPREQPEHAQLL